MDSHLLSSHSIHFPSSSPASTPSQNAGSPIPHTPGNIQKPQGHYINHNSSALPPHLTSASTLGSSPASVSSASPTSNASPASTQKDTPNGQKKAINSQPNLPPLPPGAKERIPPKSSVIKTDKPRPHVCTICTRSFARLEHLKRHERSHTKEKPFQCPVCERCFARRDLLLRHRQKLHASFPQDPPRARGGNKRKSVAAGSTGSGITTKTSAGVTKTTNATSTGAVNAAVAAAAVANGNSSNSNTPSAASMNNSSAASAPKQNLSKSDVPANSGHAENSNSPTNIATPSANTPGSMISSSSMHLDYPKQPGMSGNTNGHAGTSFSPFSSQQSPILSLNSQHGTTSNSSFSSIPFLMQSANTVHSPGSTTSLQTDMHSPNVVSLSNSFHGVNNNLENNYGDFYGLLNTSSPSTLNNLVGQGPNAQILSGNSMSFDSVHNGPTDNSISSIAAAAVAATNHSFKDSGIKDQLSKHDDFGNSHGPRSKRNRPASFSAASATSYSKYKDIAQMDSTETIPECPTQVGFATPQLIPTNLPDSDGDIPTENIFNPSDPLFINPQLLDPCFDSNFFLSNTLDNANENQNGLHDTKLSNFQEDTSPSHASLLELDNSDFSWLYPNGSSNDSNSAPRQDLFNNNFSFNSERSNNESDIAPMSCGQDLTGGNKILSQMARGGLANTSNDNKPLSTSQNSNASGSMFSNSNSWGSNNNSNSFNSQYQGNFGMPNMQQLGADMSGNNNKGFMYNNSFSNSHANLQDLNGLDSSTSSSHRITTQLRMHIMETLSMPTPFTTIQTQDLPSTQELQLYVDAYVSNFGKHLPFIHQTLEFTKENAALALGMAAIGALYLFERQQSAAIFEISRCCVHVYLESRRERKIDSDNKHETTPLWLVQALLLGVIYGLFNEELLANEIAVAQADAVISLAKSARLHLPPRNFIPMPNAAHSSINEKWEYFIKVQERIRTIHVVHTISCLLATGYNVTTKLKNSDIRCGSPCDENLWQASSADDWWSVLQQKEKDGSLSNAVEGPDFNECLSPLLSGNTLVGEVPHFTLLTLIYAIHFDIHERRLEHDKFVAQNPGYFQKKNLEKDGQRDSDTNSIVDVHWLEKEKQRTEAVLRAWETTWSLSPQASLIPKSADGSLISDSIPMSSLAHVRLYLDLRKTKECFWKRDFAGMGRELDKLAASVFSDSLSGDRKHFDALVEAASYAADTISLWEKHAARWSLQMTALETFIHSTMSLFDCGLIVSEFFHRLEKRDASTWQEDEQLLVKRLTKIFFRVFDVLFMRPENDVLHNQHQRTSGMGGHETGNFNSDSMMMMMNEVNMNNGGMGMFNNSMMNSNSPNVMMMMMQQQIPMSIIALTAVSRILSTIYIWPFSLIMAQALRARIMQIRSELTQFNNGMNGGINNGLNNNGLSNNNNGLDNLMGIAMKHNQINSGGGHGGNSNFGMPFPNNMSMNQMGNNGFGMNHNMRNSSNMNMNMNNNNNHNRNMMNNNNNGMGNMGSSNNSGNAPLNVVNMANLMSQFGAGNPNNINISQFAALFSQMKEAGMLDNLGSDGNGVNSNSNSLGANNPLAFLQQQLNIMNPGNQNNNNNNGNNININNNGNNNNNNNANGLMNGGNNGSSINDGLSLKNNNNSTGGQQQIRNSASSSGKTGGGGRNSQGSLSMSPHNNQMSPMAPSPSTSSNNNSNNNNNNNNNNSNSNTNNTASISNNNRTINANSNNNNNNERPKTGNDKQRLSSSSPGH